VWRSTLVINLNSEWKEKVMRLVHSMLLTQLDFPELLTYLPWISVTYSFVNSFLSVPTNVFSDPLTEFRHAPREGEATEQNNTLFQRWCLSSLVPSSHLLTSFDNFVFLLFRFCRGGSRGLATSAKENESDLIVEFLKR